MSDFEIDWGMEDGLHVDPNGGVDHVFTDHQFDNHHDFDHQELFDGTDSASDVTDLHTFDEIGDESHEVEATDLPEWQLDPSFTDGHYDLVGADPDEDDMWSQLMSDMHEEINPYAVN